MSSKALIHDLGELQEGEELLFLLKGRSYIVKLADHDSIEKYFERKKDGNQRESEMSKVPKVD
jgi:hypothetical protein